MARVTVVESVYYQSENNPSLTADTRFCRDLRTEEQACVRYAQAEEQWSALDMGWLKKSSMIVVENRPARLQQIPTPEEAQAAAAKVLYLGVLGPDGRPNTFAQILPGESARLHPAHVERLRIRCEVGTAQYVITVFPE